MRTLLSIACLVAFATTASAQLPPQPPHIVVTGESTVYVEPDKVLISLGFETSDMEIIAAKKKNNDIVTKAIAAITGTGVKDKDIQTDQLTIEPRWNHGFGAPRDTAPTFLGYYVRNNLVVTITDVSKVETLVTKVLESGVNYINGISFQSTEFKKHREEAREMALKAAKEKAEKMVAVLNESLGRVIEIRDLGNNIYGMQGGMGGGAGGSRGYAMAQNSFSEVPGGGENAETIALGKIAITSSVSVTFELNR